MKRLTPIILLLALLPYALGAVATSSGFTNSAGLASQLSDETGTSLAVFNTSPTLVTPILGTPTSGTLTNCTLPVGGVTGLGTGVATALATPTSANLASAITNETGSGALVFATSPTLVTPVLGSATASSITAPWFQATNFYFGVSGTATAKSGGQGLVALYNAAESDFDRIQLGGITTLFPAIKRSSATIQVRLADDSNYAALDAPLEVGSYSKTLTESSATAFVQVAVASSSCVGGVIKYTIVADDSTDFQSRSGSVNFALVNKAGTETVTFGTVSSEAAALSSGTLAVTFDGDTSPTNAVNLRANAVSSLTQTTLAIKYRVEIFGASTTVTPQ